MRIRTGVTAVVTIGMFVLSGCGADNPVGGNTRHNSKPEEVPPWIKLDDRGNIRSIGKPALDKMNTRENSKTL